MKKLILIALAFAGLNATAGTIAIKPIVEQPLCNGASTGNIKMVLAGGQSPYYYYWSNNPSYHGAHQGNLSAGTYTVSVYDAAGDSGSYTLTIAQPDPINLSISSQNVTVHGGSDGNIQLNVLSGGTPDFSYLWSNSATTENLYNLAAGTYTATVTDAFGCTATASKTISEPAKPLTGSGNHNGNLTFNPGNTFTKNNAKMEGISSSTDIAVKDNNISMFPNPAGEYINLNLESPANSQITFYNAAGQVAMQKRTTDSENKIDLTGLSNGNYIVVINNENGTVSKTVSVVK